MFAVLISDKNNNTDILSVFEDKLFAEKEAADLWFNTIIDCLTDDDKDSVITDYLPSKDFPLDALKTAVEQKFNQPASLTNNKETYDYADLFVSGMPHKLITDELVKFVADFLPNPYKVVECPKAEKSKVLAQAAKNFQIEFINVFHKHLGVMSSGYTDGYTFFFRVEDAIVYFSLDPYNMYTSFAVHSFLEDSLAGRVLEANFDISTIDVSKYGITYHSLGLSKEAITKLLNTTTELGKIHGEKWTDALRHVMSGIPNKPYSTIVDDLKRSVVRY